MFPEFQCGNLFFRFQHALQTAGGVIEGHCHNFTHPTWVTIGAVDIEAQVPHGRVLVAAHAWHEVRSALRSVEATRRLLQHDAARRGGALDAGLLSALEQQQIRLAADDVETKAAFEAAFASSGDHTPARVTIRGTDVRNWVEIRPFVRHRLTSIEDGTRAYCVYAHRDPQGRIVQEWTGWYPAYQ